MQKRTYFALFLAVLISATGSTSTRADEVIRPSSERFAKDTDEVPHFRKHVVPLLGRLGCNGRACHGSFQGQGGFQLSLFGYDFDEDLKNLMSSGDEGEVRANVENPAESLILMKPSLQMDHEGGERMKTGSWQFHLLKKWIESGAKGIEKENGKPVVKFEKLDVFPGEIVYEKQGEQTQLRAVVHWSDGTKEDVTPLCRFKTNNDQVADIGAEGLVTAKEPGDTHVVVFFDNGVVPVPVMRPVSDQVGAKYPNVPTPTRIDELVVQKLRKLGVVPSELASDAEFLRRISLDMTGTLPSPTEVEAFLSDKSPDKRSKKIEELLKRPAYAAWWATKLCDFTGNNDQNLANVVPTRDGASKDWYEWIHKRVENNTPYDKLAEGIIVANSREEGESFTEFCEEMSKIYSPKHDASFAERETMPYYWARRNFRQPAERTIGFAYSFMGIRIQCAQCHKHPFDQWTKQDFDQFTRFFASTQFGTNPASREEADKMAEELGLSGRRGNELRRAIPELLRDGKTVPVQQVYSRGGRGGRGGNNNTAQQLRRFRQQVNQLAQRIETLKKDGKDDEAKRLEPQLRQQQQRLQRLAANVRRNNGGGGTAKLLGAEEIDLGKVEDARAPVMEWLKREGNPYFARAFVNRVWANYFNVGIVNPPDDMSLANPPSNKPLLDYLTEGFINNGYDMKWLHREIANSRTYQLSWKPNDTNRRDETNFSRCVPRRLPAEVAVDAIVQATSSDEKIKELSQDLSERTISIPGTLNRSRNRNAQQSRFALEVFGRSTRESNCDCDRSLEASLLQTVYLQNDRDIQTLLTRNRDGWLGDIGRELGVRNNPVPAARGTGRPANYDRVVAQMERQIARLRQGDDKEALAAAQERLERYTQRFGGESEPAPRTPAETKEKKPMDSTEIIRQAYLRTLSRYPSKEELERCRGYMDEAENTLDGVRDVLWALINTKEFIVNH